MLDLPDWYEGGYRDAEEMVVTYFEWLLGERVYVCTWMPPNHYTLSPGEQFGTTIPTLRVWRQPGKADDEMRRDEALIQVAAITPTRKESWQLIKFVRSMLDNDVITSTTITLPDGERARFAKSQEWMGPQMVPERLVDEKFVPVTFRMALREPRDLPNYVQILKSLAA